ncbi:hypothetical protein [Alkalihalobacterium bogoriense]|uniref:hypothetical protein n=1 Tax=Alkalihalobacterium bogoriense TaxID=246272 RepID=UPI00047B6A97|nr:hypothetical protein [Alkalihalobacterium bogoriense]
MKEERKLRISISFRTEYRHLYDHVIKQANSSDYICRVLQKDYERKQSEKSLEEKIEELLAFLSKGEKLIINNDTTKLMSDRLDEEEIELINELF